MSYKVTSDPKGMSKASRSNAYRSSNSTIIAGPGTMYNEVTRPKTITKQYNDNTNTHYVTVPHSMTVKTRKSKSKTRKNKKK
ncbi:hypothetical protein M9Y10_045022 [Tritrichomonas musculus]|uniref:Uncharacterized protein n=1 Tax=Tritrichomonas musculus TaxID=1915356 RepID=A0ABR2JX21_9EUKA